MEYALAIWIGRTAACMMDVVVFIPALIVGFAARSWWLRAIGGAVALGIVPAIKLPTIRKIAIELDIPDEPAWSIALTYAGAIAIIILAVTGVRMLFRARAA